jgi:hypothetical protein
MGVTGSRTDPADGAVPDSQGPSGGCGAGFGERERAKWIQLVEVSSDWLLKKKFRRTASMAYG